MTKPVLFDGDNKNGSHKDTPNIKQKVASGKDEKNKEKSQCHSTCGGSSSSNSGSHSLMSAPTINSKKGGLKKWQGSNKEKKRQCFVPQSDTDNDLSIDSGNRETARKKGMTNGVGQVSLFHLRDGNVSA